MRVLYSLGVVVLYSASHCEAKLLVEGQLHREGKRRGGGRGEAKVKKAGRCEGEEEGSAAHLEGSRAAPHHLRILLPHVQSNLLDLTEASALASLHSIQHRAHQSGAWRPQGERAVREREREREKRGSEERAAEQGTEGGGAQQGPAALSAGSSSPMPLSL